MKIKTLGTAMLIALTALFTMAGCGGSSGDVYSVYDGSYAATSVVGDSDQADRFIAGDLADEAQESILIHTSLALLPQLLLMEESASALGDKAPTALVHNFFSRDVVKDIPKVESGPRTIATTLTGDEGIGSVTINGSLDETAYTGFVTYTFEGYAVSADGPVLDGLLTLNIAPAPDFTEENLSIIETCTWKYLTATEGDEETTFAGTIVIKVMIDGDGMSQIVSTISYTDPGGSTTTYWDDTTWSYDPDVEVLVVSGKLYNSARGGFLTVEGTFTAGSSFGGFVYPSEGTLTLTGSDGSVAELTYAAEEFTVRIDADGDGIFEYPESS